MAPEGESSMKSSAAFGTLSLLVACFGSPALAQPQPPSLNIEQAQENLAFARGVDAYIWAYPLAITAATAELATNTDKPIPNGHSPFNTFGHVGKLITAADKDVVSSNADTIYSSAFIDLKQGAALVSVPDTGGRYYSLMLEDAYTNVFGYIGLRATGNAAGTYLIAGPGWTGETPAGAKRIDAPTPLVWIIGRTLIDGEKDMPNVAAIQKQYQVTMVPPVLDSVPAKERWGIALQPKMPPVQQVDSLDWKTYFRWAGQMMKDNPPPPADSAFWKQFEAIGLTVENGFDVDHLSPATQKGLERGYEAGRQVVKMEAQKTGGVVSNGWAYNLNAGKWGQDFNLRAAIAFRSLGQNTPEEAIYMNTRQDADKQPLNGARKYTITFKKGELPPVDGFWSITMYNSSDFFVENPLNRSAIGNRTEGLKTAPDGSLTIYVQKDAPEADKMGNWLPAPDGTFRLSMRLYVPKAEILEGKWAPPAVTPQP
jgi:hypothetical protein